MHSKIKIRIRSLGLIVAVCLLYASILPYDVSLLSFIDDVIPLVFGGIWCLVFLWRGKLSKEGIIFLLLATICMLGLLSNYASELTTAKPALLDMFSFLKMFFIFLGTWAILRKKDTALQSAVQGLSQLAKIFIFIGFIFAVFNLVGIVSMYDSMRFGIKNYYFVYGNASQYGILVGVALAFVIFSESKYLWLYEIMALATMILTMKGMSLIIVAVYICMHLVSRRKIKVWQLVVVGIALMFVLRYQIYNYLLDDTAPRAILLRNGARTANAYFPLGAGFATFGSEMSGRYYSPLYVQYGMSTRGAFIYNNPGGCYINDTYLGMAMGQFGWIGTLLLLTIFAIIGGNLFVLNTKNRKAQYIVFGLFACFCGMAVMAGSIKGAPGQLILLTIQIYFLLYGKNNRKCKTDCGEVI